MVELSNVCVTHCFFFSRGERELVQCCIPCLGQGFGQQPTRPPQLCERRKENNRYDSSEVSTPLSPQRSCFEEGGVSVIRVGHIVCGMNVVDQKPPGPCLWAAVKNKVCSSPHA